MQSLFGGVKQVAKKTPLWLFLTFLLLSFSAMPSKMVYAAILPTKTFHRFANTQGYLLAEDASSTGWDAFPEHGRVWLGWANGCGRWAYMPDPLVNSDWFRSGYSTRLSNSYPYSFTFYPQPDNVQLDINIISDNPPNASWIAAASPDPGLQIVTVPSLGIITDMGTTFQYTVDLTKTPLTSTTRVYTDKFAYYVTDSTIETLPSALSAECVLGTVCHYGDMNRSRLVNVTATITDSRVVLAAESVPVRASGMLMHGGVVQGGDTCATVDANHNIDIPCISVAGQFYHVELNAYPTQSDPSGDYWSLGPFSQTIDNGSCASFNSETMTVGLPCVSVNSTEYSMSLNYYVNMADHNGLYWSLGAVQPLTY